MDDLFTIDCGDILLREFIIEDAEKVYRFAHEKDISTFLPDWQTSKEQRFEWVRDYEIPWNKEFLKAAPEANITEHMLKTGIVLKETNEFIGWCCTCIKKELSPPNREINYAVTKEHCGKGYATKAVLGLTTYLFNHTNVDHLIMIALRENTASNRVIQKSSFYFVHEIEIKNQTYNYYELSKKNWMNSQ